MNPSSLKVLQLTPGTGNFYCGSCLRDTALVKELRRQGHDAVCLPLYLPLVTDDTDGVHDKIFFGGINVYLQQQSNVFKKTPAWMDGFLNAKGLLSLAARGGNLTSPRALGELTLSMLKGEEGNQVKELDKLAGWIKSHLKPDVINLSNALLAGMARRLKRELGVPVVCTLQGEDSFLDSLPEPFREQAWSTLKERLQDCDAFIAVSEYYGHRMRERLTLPKDKLHVVPNGIVVDDFSPRASLPRPPVLGYLARMHPMKGLDKLVGAFIQLHSEPGLEDLHLQVAGACNSTDESFVAELKTKLAQAGAADKATFLPNLPREHKADFLRGLSVFSVPALYGEAFGLYVLESLACGVPVVQPDHAAFPELINATGGGLLYAPDEPGALAETLANLIRNEDQNQILGTNGHEAVTKHFSLARMAQRIISVYRQLNIDAPPSSS